MIQQSVNKNVPILEKLQNGSSKKTKQEAAGDTYAFDFVVELKGLIVRPCVSVCMDMSRKIKQQGFSFIA